MYIFMYVKTRGLSKSFNTYFTYVNAIIRAVLLYESISDRKGIELL